MLSSCPRGADRHPSTPAVDLTTRRGDASASEPAARRRRATSSRSTSTRTCARATRRPTSATGSSPCPRERPRPRSASISPPSARLALKETPGGREAAIDSLVEPRLRVRSRDRHPARAAAATAACWRTASSPARWPTPRCCAPTTTACTPATATRPVEPFLFELHAAMLRQLEPLFLAHIPAGGARARRRLRPQPVHRDPARLALHASWPPTSTTTSCASRQAEFPDVRWLVAGAQPLPFRDAVVRRAVRGRADRAPARSAARPGRVPPGAEARRHAHPHHPEPPAAGERGRRLRAALQPRPPERAALRRGARACSPQAGFEVQRATGPAPRAAAQLVLAAAQARPPPARAGTGRWAVPLDAASCWPRAPRSRATRSTSSSWRASGGSVTVDARAPHGAPRPAASPARLLAAAWSALVRRGRAWRPGWLEAVPPALARGRRALAALLGAGSGSDARSLFGAAAGPTRGALLLACRRAGLRSSGCRSPGRARRATLTPDGALSGIVALRAARRERAARVRAPACPTAAA